MHKSGDDSMAEERVREVGFGREGCEFFMEFVFRNARC